MTGGWAASRLLLAPILALLVAGCASGTVGQQEPTSTAAPEFTSITAPNTRPATSTRPAATSAPLGTGAASHARRPRPAATVATVMRTPSAARAVAAPASIANATAYLGDGGVSIAALDMRTGRTLRYGATGGMLSGSIAKLYILEALLLERQRSGQPLGEEDRELATRMIENSDNAAADSLYAAMGEGPALTRAAAALGVRHTVPGPGIYWGFNRTSADDYLALLHDLVVPSALDAASRAFVLDLMEDVETDQRWGVSAAADDGTVTRQKDGWLDAAPDSGRWLVNSVGIITADGHRVLLAVLTQHGRDFEGGIDLVEHLARVTVDALQD